MTRHGWMGAFSAALGLLTVTVLALPPHETELARYATSLKDRTRSQRHNAELALRELDGQVIAPGTVFSFNGCVGSFSRDRGYRKAPVSYNGQLIDSWGGGVCQTSTTLYNAAMLGGLQIVERNRHRFAPSYVPPGRDAAVAFNSIDLKFENNYDFPVRLVARVVSDRLEVAIVGAEAPEVRAQIYTVVRNVHEPSTVQAGSKGRYGRLRNSGKSGFNVAVFRKTGDRRELISQDVYPSMNRVIDRR